MHEIIEKLQKIYPEKTFELRPAPELFDLEKGVLHDWAVSMLPSVIMVIATSVCISVVQGLPNANEIMATLIFLEVAFIVLAVWTIFVTYKRIHKK